MPSSQRSIRSTGWATMSDQPTSPPVSRLMKCTRRGDEISKHALNPIADRVEQVRGHYVMGRLGTVALGARASHQGDSRDEITPPSLCMFSRAFGLHGLPVPARGH